MKEITMQFQVNVYNNILFFKSQKNNVKYYSEATDRNVHLEILRQFEQIFIKNSNYFIKKWN